MTGAPGLLNAALVGSSRIAVDEALPATAPEGGLVGALSDVSAEQRLLLAAGVRAIYRLAGYAPERVDVPLEPAPAEAKMVCPSPVAELLRELFPKGDVSLQQEALERLIAAGMILPPEMLPLVLGVERTVHRALVAQVVGERGAWLARFSSDWQWVRDELAHSVADMAASAETLWRDGSLADRLQALAYWRATDSERARREVAAVWRQEKSDVRMRMLAQLAPVPLAEDEALLETALDDRNANVRSLAQRLLARIPGSAYSQRAIVRADALVSMGRKKLTITLPAAYEKAWERDGIERKPRQGMDEAAWWLMRIIGLTPPAHWVERFGKSPADLIAALPGDHFTEMLEGWANATGRYHADDWASAFVGLWRQRSDRRAALERIPALADPLQLLPRAELEALALHMLRQGETKQDPPWIYLADALPRPWGEELARAWIAALREHARSLKTETQPYHDVFTSASQRALALPRVCLDEALAPWDIDTTTSTYEAIAWREHLDAFLKMARLCQRIYDEIPGEG
jgi:hypothetical protein